MELIYCSAELETFRYNYIKICLFSIINQNTFYLNTKAAEDNYYEI